MSGADAQKRWELENDVQPSDSDAIFAYDNKAQQNVQSQKPWTKDPHYFKK